MKSKRSSLATRLSSAVLMAAVVAAVGPATAHAEPSAEDPITDTLTQLGLGDRGALSSAIAEAGQSLCPKLVKPGASLATTVSELQGNTGLTPEITGMVTGLAIQLQCPALMTAIANGDLPEMLRANAEKDRPAMPFPLLGAAR